MQAKQSVDVLKGKLGKLLPEIQREKQGNHVQLLIGGKDYFPLLLDQINAARKEIQVETYIFAADAVGKQVCEALCQAAARGVRVRLVLDGFGGASATETLVPALRAAGVKVRVFRPEGFWLKPNPKRLRRMHRKLVVIDREVAFVGGINLIDDMNHAEERLNLEAAESHLDDFSWIQETASHNREVNQSLLQTSLGPRYDFAVCLKGPVVMDVWNAAEWLWWQIGPGGKVTDSLSSGWWKDRADQFNQVLADAALQNPPAVQGQARVQLLLRDNFRARRAIEKAYLKAIGEADREVLLANAYFIPGRRLRRALVMARKRGVTVKLLLQGQVEYHFQHYATQALYSSLLRAGVQIHEYLPSFLHAKVAVVDGRWATVGSSNLDPLSFLLAREANVTIQNSQAVSELQQELVRAMDQDARRVVREAHAQRPMRLRVYSWLCYGLLRLAVTLWGLSGRY